MLDAAQQRDIVPLGSAFPSPELFPLQRLAQSLTAGNRQMQPWQTVQHLPQGSASLCQQIALRYLALGMALHQQALAQGIGIAPGPIFSARQGLRHCIRLNYGHPWDARMGAAMATLGALVRTQDIYKKWASSAGNTCASCYLFNSN